MAQHLLEQPRPEPKEKLSYEQFLQWLDEDTWAEWEDGEVILMSPVSREHSRLHTFLLSLLHFFVSSRQLGEVFSEPFQMKTAPDLPGRAPDILFVRREHLDRLTETHLEGPADLVVEIVSPESEHRDRVQKLSEYEQGGVHEYWLVDPKQRRAEFYVLGDDGRYMLKMHAEQGEYESAAIEGLRLRVEWFWEQPPLAEIAQSLA